MGLGSENLEVLAGQLGVGDGEEFLLDFGLGGEVGIAEDCRGCGLRRGLPGGLGRQRSGYEREQKQEGKRVAHNPPLDSFESDDQDSQNLNLRGQGPIDSAGLSVGLNRLRRMAEFRAKYPKSMPRGQKPPLIPLRLCPG